MEHDVHEHTAHANTVAKQLMEFVIDGQGVHDSAQPKPEAQQVSFKQWLLLILHPRSNGVCVCVRVCVCVSQGS